MLKIISKQMILPKKIRNKSDELFSDNHEAHKAFLMGAAMALGYGMSDFQSDEQPCCDDYPCKEALEAWLAYKKEKRQTYKPRGLEALKKKLLQLSNGNPEYAKVIVEYSMGNNYTGLFAPKNNGINSYEQQQRTFNKINSILAD